MSLRHWDELALGPEEGPKGLGCPKASDWARIASVSYYGPDAAFGMSRRPGATPTHGAVPAIYHLSIPSSAATFVPASDDPVARGSVWGRLWRLRWAYRCPATEVRRRVAASARNLRSCSPARDPARPLPDGSGLRARSQSELKPYVCSLGNVRCRTNAGRCRAASCVPSGLSSSSRWMAPSRWGSSTRSCLLYTSDAADE